MSYKLKSDLITIAEAYSNGRPQKAGSGYKIKCPAHDGTKNSCSIDLKDGKILTKCHSRDCTHQEIMDALVLKGYAEKNTPKKRKTRVTKNRRTISTYSWDARNLKGEIIAQHERVNYDDGKKTFFWKPKLSTIGMSSKDVALYGMHLVTDEHNKLIFCEGEKSCDALWNIGIPAVASTTGAQSTPSIKVLRTLKGKIIELWPDNDDEENKHAGQRHMERISDILTNQNIINSTIIWKEAPVKGDAADFIELGNGKADIEKLPRIKNGANQDSEFWLDELKCKKDGTYKNWDSNVFIILEKHPDFKGKLGYDRRSHTPSFINMIPNVTDDDLEYPHEIKEHELGNITKWFADDMGIDVPYAKVSTLIRPTCMNPKISSQYDPFLDYLEGVKWDGVERIGNSLLEHASARNSEISEDSEYIKTVFKCTMISAVARTYKPGCKVDNMLILVGEQGSGKSSLFRALLPSNKYFIDHIPDLRNADARSQLHGIVFLEIAELEAFGNVATAAIKSFLTAQIDKFRPSYGRTAVEFPRTCVFVGSTNSDAFLKDETGSRRFWPVKIDGGIDIKWFENNRDQLWAEAVTKYKAGEKWWLDGRVNNDQKKMADEYREEMTWENQIFRYLKKNYAQAPNSVSKDCFDEKNNRKFITIDEIFIEALGIETPRQSPKEQKQIAKVLRLLGWERKRPIIDNARVYAYRAPENFWENIEKDNKKPDEKENKTEDLHQDNVVEFTKAVQQTFDIEEKPKEDLSGPADY